MQETLIWALMLLAEAFLLSSGILGFLLWRARKLQRRLRAELAEIQRASHAGVAPALSVPAPVAVFDAELAELAETVETRPDTAELSEVVAILPDRQSVYVVRENGSVATHEIATLAVSSEERRGGHVCAATVLPWLGSVRLLLAMEDGPIQCLGTEDQLVTQYLSPHRGLRMLAAASDWVLAVSADRQRVVMWNSWDGKKPAADLSIAAIAKHRIADVDFG